MTVPQNRERAGVVPEVSVRSGDPDEAREIGTLILHRHRLVVLGDAARFSMSLDAASLGPLTLGWLTYGTEVRLESSHQGYYQVNIPSAGTMLAASGGQQVISTPGMGTIYVPDRAAVLTNWATPAPMLALRIARQALEHQMEQLLDRPVGRAVNFNLNVDVATGRGAQWSALVRSLATGVTDEDSLVRHPMVALPFAHSVMTGLLMTAVHPHRDELASPVASVGSSAVKTACAYMEANADKPITVAHVARAAGVGVRSLQQGFQKSLDMSPTQYLRQVRLRHVHRELLTAEPGTTTVGEVAARWGFPHQGRLAAQYRERYGRHPGETLRH